LVQDLLTEDRWGNSEDPTLPFTVVLDDGSCEMMSAATLEPLLLPDVLDGCVVRRIFLMAIHEPPICRSPAAPSLSARKTSSSATSQPLKFRLF
jgi:hypothetical protein